MKSKYTRNSLIHQALESLDRHPRSPEELRTSLINISINRFNEYVTVPLLADNLANHEDGVMYLTAFGREKLSELGMVKSKLPSSHKLNMMGTHYDGKELAVSVMRPGADDHMKWPSRVNNELYYKDGTVEVLA
jgi:hypothetical protein